MPLCWHHSSWQHSKSRAHFSVAYAPGRKWTKVVAKSQDEPHCTECTICTVQYMEIKAQNRTNYTCIRLHFHTCSKHFSLTKNKNKRTIKLFHLGHCCTPTHNLIWTSHYCSWITDLPVWTKKLQPIPSNLPQHDYMALHRNSSSAFPSCSTSRHNFNYISSRWIVLNG